MASITPNNGRVSFVAAHDPHTYWELNSTNLGTNFGDDTSGNDDNTAVGAGDISTQESYEGMDSENDPQADGWMDIYIITDAAALVYIPAGLSHGTNYGLFHNGGGVNAQCGWLRATTTGVEVAASHNDATNNRECVIEEIPDADLPGWFVVGWQFCGDSGSQGDISLWINGTRVRNATRTYQLDYGSGNPYLGNSAGREPEEAGCLDPSDYSGGNWGNRNAINGSGILIANFTCDNPTQASSGDSSPGAGDSFYSDYYDAHTASSVDDLLADDVEADSEVSAPAVGQEHALLATSVESASEVGAPAIGQEHALLADDVESASEVTAPVLAEAHVLDANDLESASEVTSPAIGQEHALLAGDVQSTPEVAAPAVGQEHALLADDVEAASEVDSPAVGQEHALLADDTESTSEVSAPAVGQTHALLADDVESTSEVFSPAVGQVHVIAADDLESLSELSAPTLAESGGTDNLLAEDLECLSELSASMLGQVHVLTASSVESLSQVSSPSVGEPGGGGQGKRNHKMNLGRIGGMGM